MRLPNLASWAALLLAGSASARFLIYADEWHDTRPTSPKDRAGIDAVIIAFAMANNTANFQPTKPSIATIRSEYPDSKVMIAIGGWGDNIGFDEASKSAAAIAKFAADVQTMLTNTGADGVDIDWEYPAGNGADYKKVPNSAKTYQIEAFPKLLAATRKAIGNTKLLSIAVPGKKGDMIAFTKDTGPKIWPSVDYVNIMSYDLMNRRDTVTNHHTSVEGSKKAVQNYLAIGAPANKINLGFAFYAKFFATVGDCETPLGCPIEEAEDANGDDTHKSGAWTYEKAHIAPYDRSKITPSYDGTCGPDKMKSCATGCCSQYGNCGMSKEHCTGGCQHDFSAAGSCQDADVFGSWQNAMNNGTTDDEAGGEYYFDPDNKLFWTWDTPALIERKFNEIVDEYGLGGVMAWSLGEDSYDWSHIKQISGEASKRQKATKKLPKPLSKEPEEQSELEVPEQLEQLDSEQLVKPERPVQPVQSVQAMQPQQPQQSRHPEQLEMGDISVENENLEQSDEGDWGEEGVDWFWDNGE